MRLLWGRLLTCGGLATRLFAADAKPSLESQFTITVRPFIESYCIGCHSGSKAMAQFDLRKYSTIAAVIEDHAHWSTVLEKLSAKEMPPPQMKQPPAEAREKVINWITALRKQEARKNAGDPGVVLARRLSNAEYNYTIRDLTGVDIRPTREFPVDPANPAGFDNSGESLGMSPALVTKYLQAAREVADHMLLRPSGIAFAPHPMLVETDRDKYCVKQIIDFYQRQNTDYGDYFRVAWMYKHRVALGQPNATLSSLATLNHVSAKYLATIWRTLEVPKEDAGPVAKLQSMWRELPAPKGKQPELARAGCDRMRDFVVQLRRKIQPTVTNLTAKGISNTAQPFLIWRNNQYAANRLKFDPSVLQVEGEARKAAPVATQKKEMTDNDAEEEPAPKVVAKPTGPDPDLHVPAGQRARYEAAFGRFASVFPDAFYVSERGRYFPDNTRDKGRHLSAGFHNLMGYYRDDGPLYDLILDEKGRKELDALWKDMDFVASANIRTYVQFYMFESKEAAKGAAEDKEITSEPRIHKVKENYLARATAAGSDVAAKAIEDHFEAVNAGVRWVERERAAAEPRHLDALEKFAARAYRRSLTSDERNDLRAYYRSLRDTDGLSHEEAIRESIVSVLMSPDFCYRVDLVETSAAKGRAQPLSDTALASRLSYFLWSSMPDDKLLARATAGTLRNPTTLAAEARRMLKDDRARGLATEFGGNWLDFRRFEEINTVDRERFPIFDNALRQAMFEEPVRFLQDVIRNDRSVLEFVNAKHTFVNPVLAKHYGIPGITGGPEDWTRVDDATPYARGGLLPMAAFLTKNAPGLRTSPVKRGYWVVKRVLGEQIPPPPAVVPELPRDEAKLDLPLRDVLARHREDPSCSACHARFDSLGLALEGFGPVGERRAKDLAGHPVDTRAEFPGGHNGDGLQGIRDYIRTYRQDDFVTNLCRKMMVYALGRSLVLSDEPAIESMRAKLAANGYRFSVLVESIVTSPQFLTKR